MDVKDADGRGLGQGFGVETSLRHRMVGGSGCNVDGSSFQSLLESVNQNLCTSLHQHLLFFGPVYVFCTSLFTILLTISVWQ